MTEEYTKLQLGRQEELTRRIQERLANGDKDLKSAEALVWKGRILGSPAAGESCGHDEVQNCVNAK